MRGEMYECSWPGDVAAYYTRALWVPEANLLFQWNMPRVIVQVVHCTEFPPSGFAKSVTLIGRPFVPYRVVRVGRNHVRKLAHVRAQEEVLRDALRRITDEALYSEERLRAVLLKAQFPR